VQHVFIIELVDMGKAAELCEKGAVQQR